MRTLLLFFLLLPIQLTFSRPQSDEPSRSSRTLRCASALQRLLPDLLTRSKKERVVDNPPFYDIEHVPYEGMTKVLGQQSNIGNYASVEFKYRDEEVPRKVRGRIVDDYNGGIDILDEKTGEVLQCNANAGNFISVKVQPFLHQPRLVTVRRARELFKAVENTPSPYIGIILDIPGAEKKYFKFVYGRAEKVEVEPGYFVVAIQDNHNVRHLIDPQYVTFQAIVQSGDKLKNLFQHGKIKPILLFDRTRAKRQELAKHWASGDSVYDSDTLYDWLASDIEDAKKIIERWFFEAGPKMIASVEKGLGEKYIPLLVDPGIANRFSDFVAFSRGFLKSHKGASALELRQAFSAHLGTRKVYRGMMLTDEEKAEVMKAGIAAPGMRTPAIAISAFTELFDPMTKLGVRENHLSPGDEISSRVSGSNPPEWMYLSVSEHEPVAASVAYHWLGQNRHPSKHLYVFELNIPEISVLKSEGLFAKLRSESGYFTVGDRFKVRWEDNGVEMFVPYFIPPGDITSVKKYDHPPPGFK